MPVHAFEEPSVEELISVPPVSFHCFQGNVGGARALKSFGAWARIRKTHKPGKWFQSLAVFSRGEASEGDREERQSGGRMWPSGQDIIFT